jgi:hypothetical protein
VDSHRRETRPLAALALLALVAGIVSDAFAHHFWDRHALLADRAASLIFVMLTVALVNEVVERRKRRRWRVLAQYVVLELVRHARMVWTGIIELAGLVPSDAHSAASAKRRRSRGTGHAATGQVDPRAHRRRGPTPAPSRGASTAARLAATRARPVDRGNAGADAYAQPIDRHVELASDVAWLGSLLDQFEPIDQERGRQRMSHSNPAVQIVGEIDDDQLADRVVGITQLAEGLDRGTLELALRIVPAEWWAAHHGRTASISSVGPDARRPPPDPKPTCVIGPAARDPQRLLGDFYRGP